MTGRYPAWYRFIEGYFFMRIRRTASTTLFLFSLLAGTIPTALGREAKVSSTVPPEEARCNAKCKDQIAEERKDPGAAEGCLIRCMEEERAKGAKKRGQVIQAK